MCKFKLHLIPTVVWKCLVRSTNKHQAPLTFLPWRAPHGWDTCPAACKTAGISFCWQRRLFPNHSAGFLLSNLFLKPEPEMVHAIIVERVYCQGWRGGGGRRQTGRSWCQFLSVVDAMCNGYLKPLGIQKQDIFTYYSFAQPSGWPYV